MYIYVFWGGRLWGDIVFTIDRVHAKRESLCCSSWTADHRVTVRLSDDMFRNKHMKCVTFYSSGHISHADTDVPVCFIKRQCKHPWVCPCCQLTWLLSDKYSVIMQTMLKVRIKGSRFVHTDRADGSTNVFPSTSRTITWKWKFFLAFKIWFLHQASVSGSLLIYPPNMHETWQRKPKQFFLHYFFHKE